MFYSLNKLIKLIGLTMMGFFLLNVNSIILAQSNDSSMIIHFQNLIDAKKYTEADQAIRQYINTSSQAKPYSIYKLKSDALFYLGKYRASLEASRTNLHLNTSKQDSTQIFKLLKEVEVTFYSKLPANNAISIKS